MGLYATHVVPRIINVACGMKSLAPLRERVASGLHGEVVEIGFGSGHNVPFYPSTVARVAAVEPSDLGWRLAEPRRNAATVTVERSGLDGQSLPFPDDTFDSALSTWTMCTIPDVDAALERGTPRAEAGRHAAFPRTRPRTRPSRAALAASARPVGATPVRRLPTSTDRSPRS